MKTLKSFLLRNISLKNLLWRVADSSWDALLEKTFIKISEMMLL